jgi:hypothetical protein
MTVLHPSDQELFANLRELAESSFPKRCRNCGRVYADAAEFAAATRPLDPARSGLKQSYDDEGMPIVELFRNCVCGSTLMDAFGDRRDTSTHGAARRRRFDALFGQLVARGVDPEVAHRELLSFMHGHGSELVRLIANPRAPSADGRDATS